MSIKKTYIPAKPRSSKLVGTSMSGGVAGSVSSSSADQNAHSHSNKVVLDKLTDGDIDVLGKLSLDEEGNIKVDATLWATGGISALGLRESGSGGGGGEFDRLDKWEDYNATKAGWVLSALLGQDLNTRVNALQSGSATNIEISGSGNAITGVSKDGNILTFSKGSTFSLSTHNHDAIYKPIGYEPSWGEVTGKPATFAPSAHTHTIANVTGLQTALDGKEPSFTKNTAFNKNFGTTAGTVAQGNDSRINNGQTAFGWGNHSSAGYALNTSLTAHTGNTTIHITATERTNWNDANSKKHTHSNKALLDLISQSNIDVLAKLSIVDGNIKVDTTLWATGGISALGLGEGGGSSGGGVDMLDSWANYTEAKADFYAPASLLVPFRSDTLSRLTSLESGSATSIVTTGSGNAITSLTKSGSVITATKGLSFALSTHNHDNIINWSDGQTTAQTYSQLPNGISVAFTSNIGGYGGYGSVLNVKTYPSSGGGTLQLYIPYSDQYGGTGLKYRKFNYNGDWGSLNTIWDSNNLTNLNQLTTRNFSDLQNKPTTLGGYGITDGVTLNTAQAITGDKTFDANIILGVNRYIRGTDNYSGVWNVDDLLWRFGSGKAGSIANIRSEKVGIGTDNPLYKLDVSGTGRFTGNVTAPTIIASTSVSTPQLSNGDVYIRHASGSNTIISSGAGGMIYLRPNGDTAHSIEATLNGSGVLSLPSIEASTSVTTPKVDFGNGFTIEPSGTELVFKYNNVIKQRMLSDGTVLATGGLTALST